MAMTSDPYALLGVPRGATLTQIKAAHRALAKRYHPDSPTADAKRFLRVQEAYQLLADPLRRREWDARHAPLRADQPAAASPRARRAPASARRPPEPPREQASRTYTWSAGEVPWWEDVARDGRRAARPRRPAGRPPGPATAGPNAGASSDASAAPDTGAAPDPTPGSDPGVGSDAAARPAPDDAPPRNEFDVYSRSSGAAWSSAARAYFRRVDQDLPRRGSFHRQGSQPLTAARARAAQETLAAREPRATPGAASSSSQPSEPARPPAGEAEQRATAFGSAPPVYAYAGVAHDADEITAVRHLARERERAARWPSMGQRVRFALLAWLPIALLIGYGAPHAMGCAELGGCPPSMAAGQALTAAAALALLLALPRLAYVLGVASAGVIVAGGAALLLAWLMGLRAPQAATLPGWAIVGFGVVLLAAYLVAGTWLLTDRRRLPWVGPPGGPR